MIKIHSSGRALFLKGWNKHIKTTKRKKRKHTTFNNSFDNGLLSVSNPILKFVDSISTNKELDKRCIKDSRITVPKHFSFFDAPEKALKFICAVSRVVSSGNKKSFTLDYSNSKQYCLGAECLLSVAVREARQNNPNFPDDTIQIHGVYPKKAQHLEIIRDVGIVKDMHESRIHPIQDYTKKKPKQKQRIFREDSIGKEEASAHASDRKNITAENFTKYINECLFDHKLILKEEAARHLTSCMGELLDNAERHCGLTQRPRWFVRGYVNNSSKNPLCELAVFNFGKTICETFSELPHDHYSLSEQVEPYVQQHLYKLGMYREGLTTVAALQGRVSCKNVLDTDSCGTGTIELLKFFQDMHDNLSRINGKMDEKPKMSLISGSTHIVFDGTYALRTRLINDGQSEVVSYPFNNVGLEKEPDRAYLKRMKGASFPGLMINIRFPLQKTVQI